MCRFALLFLILRTIGLAAQILPHATQLEIEKLITQAMSRQTIPAVSVAVAVGGEPLWASGFGMADVENYVPAKAATAYRTGSIAKPVTAVAVLQLAEAGRIDLDAPIQRYVPSFPLKQAPVSARQLLGHVGGIRHYLNLEEVNSTRHYNDLVSSLRLFQEDPLVGDPGTLYRYSTYGYVLLGAAVESLTSVRFVDYLRQRIFLPAGMEHSRQDHVFAIIPNRARGYALNSTGQLQNCSLADTSNKIPGGGLISTVEDLVRFALAVRSGKLLKQPTVDRMFTALRLRDGRSTEYGYGWAVGSLEGHKLVGHTGGQQGVSTILSMLPREGAVVALMCNREKAELRELSHRILHLLLDVAPRRESAARPQR